MTHTQLISTAVAVSLALIVAIALLFFGPAIFTPFRSTSADAEHSLQLEQQAATMNDQSNGVPGQPSSELGGRDIVVGSGAEAVAGKQVTVHYVGRLSDGTVFDASANHGQPFTFTLGAGQVIKGWDMGVAGMKVGGKRELVIPPALGYGAQGAGGVIPPNATLIFEVELLEVR